MTDCAKSDNRIIPISKIKFGFSDVIVELLNKYQITGCNFPKLGYCDQKKCDLQNDPNFNIIPNSCQCSFFTFLANLKLGLIESMYCVIADQGSFAATLVEQDVYVNIFSLGNIDSAKTEIKQYADVSIKILNTKDIQDELSNVSYDALVDILDQAQYDEEMISNPVNVQIIELFYEYLEQIKGEVKLGVEDETDNMYQQAEILQRSGVISINKQSIVVSVNANYIKNLKTEVTTDIILRIITENITNVVLGNIIQKVLGDKIDEIMENTKKDLCVSSASKVPVIVTSSIAGILFLVGIWIVYKKIMAKRQQKMIQKIAQKVVQVKAGQGKATQAKTVQGKAIGTQGKAIAAMPPI
jgi:hypothetical protein